MKHTQSIDCVILCGGIGSRLRSISLRRPKALIRVGGWPFLDIVLKWLKKSGSYRIILAVGFKANQMKNHYRKQNREIVFSTEKIPLGTAGGLKQSERFVKSDPFIVMNGDSYCDVDLKKLRKQHQKTHSLVTVAVVRPDTRHDGGYVFLDGKKRVLSFSEKTRKRGTYMNAGIYVCSRDLFRRIPKNKKCSLEEDVFPAIPKEKFGAYVTNEKLYDIGTPDRLRYFRKAFPKLTGMKAVRS